MRVLNPHTTIHDLLAAHPFLIEDLPAAYPAFAPLRNPALRAVMARVATLERAAGMAGVPVQQLMDELAGMIRRRTGVEVVPFAAAPPADRAARIQALKGIIRQLHDGAPLEEARRAFEAAVGQAAPQEIAEMEQALIREGMPVQEIRRLCDVHVGVVCGSLDQQPAPVVPPGHPVHTYQAENRALEQAAARWTALCQSPTPPAAGELSAALAALAQVTVHYTRKENQLFPALERHGFTGPSTVMWAVHDDIRARLKAAQRAVERNDHAVLAVLGPEVAGHITSMIYKEEKILFPTALSLLAEEEWVRIRAGDDAIGYALIIPAAPWPATPPAAIIPAPPAAAGLVQLATGALTPEQLTGLLVSLPVEISFVDHEDRVQFYSDHPHRIFPRSPEVIGRAVQNCHPQKSVHLVNAILEAFRAGTRSEAKFWIEFKGRFILIAYYAVRAADGRYLGCTEVTQDITDIRGLQGEQRLLDWD